jgi:hypothetical protein
LPTGNAEGDIVDGAHPSEGFADPFDDEHGRGGRGGLQGTDAPHVLRDCLVVVSIGADASEKDVA